MVSDFRRKKLLHVFNAFIDTDHSGAVDKKDFELAVKNISKLRGWKEGDVKYNETQDLLMNIWAGLQNSADVDNDGEVSKEEWIALWDKYSKDPSSAQEWQKLYSKFIFQLEDASNDGAIDVDEFVSVYVSLGLDRQESVESFEKIARGKSSVSWEQFQELWREYFTTEDKEAPGNFIFGCYICSLDPHSHSHSH